MVAKLSNAGSTTARVETLMATYQPENDIRVLIERYRTGSFRPVAQVYESISHDKSDVVFGIGRRKWSDSAYWNVRSPGEKNERKDEAPPMPSTLLAALV